MLSGLVIVLLPLLLGYLVPVRHASLMALINRGVNASVYVILLLMGVSLAGLDDLGSQLSRMGGQALTLFAVIGACNLAGLWWLSRRLGLAADPSRVVPGAPTSKLAAMAGSLALVGVVVLGVGGRGLRRAPRHHHDQRAGHGPEGRDHGPGGQPGAAPARRQHPARRAVHRPAHQD